MKSEHPEPEIDKPDRERFDQLGSKLMTVPRAEVVALEKKWQSRKRRKAKKVTRG